MEFNAEQLAAIEHPSRHLLVLAGAGTGKTRTIVGRAQHLIRGGCDPKKIVIVTFTRRAASELKQRLGGGAGASQIVTGTFHHLCLRIMNTRRRWFGFSDMTMLDRDDQLQLMKLVRADIVGKTAQVPQANLLLNYYSYARNTNQPAQDYLVKHADLDESLIEPVLKIFKGYRDRKQAGAYLDYDDILHRFAKVLHDDPDIRHQVTAQYEHVLVDEMQDTNPLQWLILESFASNCRLFCVGDDAQSIYAFRGADFQNVHSFDQRLANSSTAKLQQNYRSTQEILDVANWLLSRSRLDYDKELESVRGEGMRPQLLDFDSEFDEARWISERIQQGRAEGSAWSANMILCRTAFSARPIEAQLIEDRIPYRFVGGMSLLQMAHVKDLLSVLRLATNHKDELAWMRYLTMWPRIGDVTASKMVRQLLPAPNSRAAAELLTEIAPRADIAECLQAVLQHEDSPTKAISEAHKRLEPILETRYDRWDSRSKDFKLLEQLAKNHRSLQSFLDTYTLDPVSATEVEPSEGGEEGIVTLITVHSAKGTEADVCFVTAAQPGNYPHSRSLGDDDAVEEERRVLYVALTRARNELYISRSLSRGHARLSWNAAQGAEYFLDDLPPGLVDWKLAEARGYRSRKYDYYDDDVIG